VHLADENIRCSVVNNSASYTALSTCSLIRCHIHKPVSQSINLLSNRKPVGLIQVASVCYHQYVSDNTCIYS